MTNKHETGFTCLAAWEIGRGAQVVAVGELDDGRIALLKGPIPADAPRSADGVRVLTEEGMAGLKPDVPAFSIEQARGLAMNVLQDNPQAITRPTALKELAAFTVAMLASLSRAEQKETDGG